MYLKVVVLLFFLEFAMPQDAWQEQSFFSRFSVCVLSFKKYREQVKNVQIVNFKPAKIIRVSWDPNSMEAFYDPLDWNLDAKVTHSEIRKVAMLEDSAWIWNDSGLYKCPFRKECKLLLDNSGNVELLQYVAMDQAVIVKGGRIYNFVLFTQDYLYGTPLDQKVPKTQKIPLQENIVSYFGSLSYQDKFFPVVSTGQNLCVWEIPNNSMLKPEPFCQKLEGHLRGIREVKFYWRTFNIAGLLFVADDGVYDILLTFTIDKSDITCEWGDITIYFPKQGNNILNLNLIASATYTDGNQYDQTWYPNIIFSEGRDLILVNAVTGFSHAQQFPNDILFIHVNYLGTTADSDEYQAELSVFISTADSRLFIYNWKKRQIVDITFNLPTLNGSPSGILIVRKENTAFQSISVNLQIDKVIYSYKHEEHPLLETASQEFVEKAISDNNTPFSSLFEIRNRENAKYKPERQKGDQCWAYQLLGLMNFYDKQQSQYKEGCEISSNGSQTIYGETIDCCQGKPDARCDIGENYDTQNKFLRMMRKPKEFFNVGGLSAESITPLYIEGLLTTGHLISVDFKKGKEKKNPEIHTMTVVGIAKTNSQAYVVQMIDTNDPRTPIWIPFSRLNEFKLATEKYVLENWNWMIDVVEAFSDTHSGPSVEL